MSAQNTQEGQFSFVEVFKNVTQPLPERSRDILRRRFGIGQRKTQTLESIGKKYGITRERVRQIIKTGLDSAQNALSKRDFTRAEKKILYTVDQKNGIIKEDILFATLGCTKQEDIGIVQFFIVASDALAYFDDKKNPVHTTVVTQSFDNDLWQTVHAQTTNALALHGDTMHIEELFDAIIYTDQKAFINYIDVSREIEQNPFGKWGLAHWDEITPKGIREKVYLVVKEKNVPMHFREIAETIDAYNLNKKGRNAHPQTVHNELIKDDRFVLVGRGIYALKDWGYNTGTVRDVVRDVLEQQKVPMHQDDILSHVLKVRKVKKSTVLINLHNFFQRVDQDRYTVKQ